MTSCECGALDRVGVSCAGWCPGRAESGEIDSRALPTSTGAASFAVADASEVAARVPPLFSTARDSAAHRPTGDRSHEPSSSPVERGLAELRDAKPVVLVSCDWPGPFDFTDCGGDM